MTGSSVYIWPLVYPCYTGDSGHEATMYPDVEVTILSHEAVTTRMNPSPPWDTWQMMTTSNLDNMPKSSAAILLATLE